MVATDDQNLWIFGFGSLIYKAGFEYAERLEGYIKGYKYVVLRLSRWPSESQF